VPKKSERERKTKGEIREEIRDKISPPLDSAAVSELVGGVLRWWVRTWWSGSSGAGCTQQGAGPLAFYTLWVPVS